MIYNIVPSVNHCYPPCLTNFLNYLEVIKGKSPNTIEGYRNDLVIFLKYMLIYKGVVPNTTDFDSVPIEKADFAFLNTITLTDLYSFMAFLEKQRNNGTYARARKVASLKSFFQYLHSKERAISDNPAIDLETPKISKRHPVYLTLDQSVTLMNSLNPNKKNYYRDYCILTLFINCGLRLSELCSIQISKIKQDTLTIIGKGNKERTVYLNDLALKSIKTYLEHRDDSVISPEYQDMLFLSTRNTPINKRTVEILVKKHITDAGITDGKYTPHKLRHTAATILYKHGNVDIRKLQSILGHENLSTTQIYTHVDEKDLRDAINSNPLTRLLTEES
ncbi:MAG: tyrosine recombinase XerC [Lachnospiraceae bacterium]|nr:tyrosine recombinase XerC [Lachnospiraceae bacterium]